MKVLEVHPIDEGISKGQVKISQLQSQVERIGTAMTAIINLQEALKGEMGQSICDFYANGHMPIVYYVVVLTAKYSKKDRVYTISFNKDDEISGFYLK